MAATLIGVRIVNKIIDRYTCPVRFYLFYDSEDPTKVGYAVRCEYYTASGSVNVNTEPSGASSAKLYINNNLAATENCAYIGYKSVYSDVAFVSYRYRANYTSDEYISDYSPIKPHNWYDLSPAYNFSFKIEYTDAYGTTSAAFAYEIPLECTLTLDSDSITAGEDFNITLNGVYVEGIKWKVTAYSLSEDGHVVHASKEFTPTGETFTGTFKIPLLDYLAYLRSVSDLIRESLIALDVEVIAPSKTWPGIGAAPVCKLPTGATITLANAYTCGTQGSMSIVASQATSGMTMTYVVTAKLANRTSAEKTVGTYHAAGQISYTPALSDWGSLINSALQDTIKVTIKSYIGSSASASALLSTASSNTTLNLGNTSALTPTPSATISDPSGYYAQIGTFVSGLSKLAATISDGLKYGATTRSRRVTVNGNVYSAASFTTGFLLATSTSMVIEITDSRGLSSTVTVSIPIIEWYAPQITTFDVHRGKLVNNVWVADDNGGIYKINYAVRVAPVDNGNAVVIVIDAPDGVKRPTIPPAPQKYTTSGSIIGEASTEYSYTITITLTDSYTSISKSIVISTAGVLMDFRRGGKGIALGKVSEYENCLEINRDWEIRLKGMTLAEYIVQVISSMNS